MDTTYVRSHLLIGIGSGLAALVLLTMLLLTHLPGFSPRLFALDLQTAMGMRQPTCATAPQPTAALCNNQDPVAQGCVADVQTTASATIVENGTVIGRLERRHSPKCHTYWGRVFDLRPQKMPLAISIDSPGIGSFTWKDTEAYSNMVFVPTPQDQVPAMEGILSTISQSDPLRKEMHPLTAQLPAVPSSKEP